MKNVGEIINCYGCGICAASCPANIVEIGLNVHGYYEPRITNQSKCIECGLCLKNCAFHQDALASEPTHLQSWGAWSNDAIIRKKCSSGGLGFEICRQLLNDGYKIIACKYNYDKNIAEHYVAQSVDSLIDSIGSKYIQSYTPDAIRKMNRSEKYVIVGTPCQIDSIRRLVRQKKMDENVILIDFFCHCVPSMLSWNAYTKMVEKKIGHIEYISWRNKLEYGWHDSWIMSANTGNDSSIRNDIEDSTSKTDKWISKKTQGDLFYKIFLGELDINPACSKNCKYKMSNSSADIRIGDAWGDHYKMNEYGVSAVLGLTSKGIDIITSLKNITLEPIPYQVATEGQMKKNARPKAMSPIVKVMLRKKMPLDGFTFSSVFFAQRLLSKVRRTLKL